MFGIRPRQIFIVVANASEAKCYQSRRIGRDLKPLSLYLHPEGRKKEQELVTDGPGHYQARGGTSRGEYASPLAKQVEMDRFAKYLADEFYQAWTKRKFKYLLLIAPPHFYGLLKQHLSEQLLKCLFYTIEKDYTKLTEQELIIRLASLDIAI